jgi:hypothetical protein
MRLHSPARCQSRKRRQHVMPLPQPSSWGSISQGMPLLKTNTMPVSAARSVMVRGLPPLGLDRSRGKKGATISHNLSLINGVLIPPIYHATWVLLGALNEVRRAPRWGKRRRGPQPDRLHVVSSIASHIPRQEVTNHTWPWYP